MTFLNSANRRKTIGERKKKFNRVRLPADENFSYKKKGETTSRVGGVKYVTLGLPLASKPSGPKMICRLSGRIKKSSEPITPV
jgi:hypothetical protein